MAVPKLQAEATHFFKIILEDSLRHGKLKIPDKFWRKFGSGIPSSVELLAPCGAVWKVEAVRKSEREGWFQNGWRKFAEHYSLSHGHFLVFRYEGDGKFHVVIFDKTATEIDYPIVLSDDEAFGPREEGSEQRPCRKRRGKSPLPCPKPSKSIKTISTSEKLRERNGGLLSESQIRQPEKVHRRIRPLTADEKCRALQKASDFKSKYPFLVVAMQPSYVNFGYSFKIPVGFIKKYLIKKQGELILQILDGSSWTVDYKITMERNARRERIFCKWKAFAEDNNLEVGDVCVFELIDIIELLFKVIIYRNHDSPNCFQSQGIMPTTQKCIKPEANWSIQPPPPDEVACQTPLGFNPQNPCFVVAMKPCYVNLKKCGLHIPKKFAIEHLKESHHKVHLRVHDGRNWDVKYNVRQSRGQLITNFDSSWKEFVRDNNLKVGDSCFFELIPGQKISFSVVIKRATEDANLGLSTQYGGECRELKSETDLPSSQKHSCLITTPATEAANKSISNSRFFMVVIRSYYLKSYLMEHVKRNDTSATLATGGKSWAVKIASCYGHCSFTAGWHVFAKENSLQTGDICAFELIKKAQMVFKVSIFRCKQDKLI